MSDLKRLLDGGGDELERSLLDATRDDDEDRARMKRTLSALGLGFPGPVAPPPTDGGAAASSGALTKWIVLGAIGGAVGIGAVAAAQRQPEPAPAPALAPSAAELAPTASQREPAAPPAQTSAPAPAPAPAPRRPPPAPAVSSAAPAKQSASDLKREIAALDRARAALRSGDTERARKELDRYDYEFPFGYLGPEARALRARLDKKDDAPKNE